MSFLLKKGNTTVLDTDSLGVSAILVELPAANPDIDVTNLPQSYGAVMTYAGINPGTFEFDITIRETSASKALAKAETISGALHPSNGMQQLYMDSLTTPGQPLQEGWVHSVILNRSVEWKRDKDLWPSTPGGEGVAQLTARVEFISPDPHGYKTTTVASSAGKVSFTPEGNVPAQLEVRISGLSRNYTRSSPLSVRVSYGSTGDTVRLANFSASTSTTTVLNFKDMEFYQESGKGLAVKRVKNLADRFIEFTPITLPAGQLSSLSVFDSEGSSISYKAVLHERRI